MSAPYILVLYYSRHGATAQMARQIARLQLPVLRAALGDATFFSSRKHPVRRFVNRIASLAAAYDDFGDEDARRFLARVRLPIPIARQEG